MPVGFHPIADVNAKVEMGGRTRRFVGEGTLFLKVPGLLKFESMSCEGHIWPSKHIVRYPVDLSDRRETMELDMVHHTHLPDGTSILMRSICSNDGHFQSFVPFDVTGEWDDAVPAPEPEVPQAPPQPRKGQR